MFIARKGGMSFVTRNPTIYHDYREGNFTWDAAWHDLDMSAIVPLSAKLVLITIRYNWSHAGNSVALRHPDDTNSDGSIVIIQQVANQGFFQTILVPVKNGKVSYKQWNGAAQLYMWRVVGWFL